MSWAALLLSIACLIVTSLLIARRLAPPGPDRFWIGIAAAPAQLGLIFSATSLVHRLGPAPVLALQMVLLGAVAVLTRLKAGSPGPPPPPRVVPRDPIGIALAIAIVAVLAVSGVQQAITPVWGPDEGLYHGPRIAYWLQERTIFLERNHNDRQTVFPFGAELFVAWPLLFVREEWLGRMAFWAAFPAAAAGIRILARTIGAGPRAALAGTLLYVSTPTVLDHAASLKSDAWLPLFLLGAAYASIRPRAPIERPGARFLLAGFLLGLAVNVKTTALALAPGLVFAPLLDREPRRIGRCLNGLAAGLVLSAAVSGLGILLTTNVARYGHALGPPELTAIVQPRFSARQMLVHAARAPLFLFQLPEIPAETVRARLETIGTRLADRLGATTTLQWEEPGAWPGPYVFRVRQVSNAYSLGGLVWLPVLAAGLLAAGWQAARTWPRPVLSPAASLAVIQLPLFLGVVLMIRWMSAGPYRFWLPAYALAIPLAARLIGELAARRRVAAGLVACALPAAVYPSFREQVVAVDDAINRPRPAALLDRPYQEIAPRLPAGARILLVAGGNTREYGLFNPRGGFTNVVIPWGLREFDPGRAGALLRDHRISHVVIEHDKAISSPWIGGVRTDGAVSWMQARNEFRQVPLTTPHMRLFERTEP